MASEHCVSMRYVIINDHDDLYNNDEENAKMHIYFSFS